MEATAATGDPRRLMVFQDVRQEKLVREAFDLRTEQVARRQVFNYLTPDRRYTYHRMPLGE
jgi:hypothetical protein